MEHVGIDVRQKYSEICELSEAGAVNASSHETDHRFRPLGEGVSLA